MEAAEQGSEANIYGAKEKGVHMHTVLSRSVEEEEVESIVLVQNDEEAAGASQKVGNGKKDKCHAKNKLRKTEGVLQGTVGKGKLGKKQLRLQLYNKDKLKNSEEELEGVLQGEEGKQKKSKEQAIDIEEGEHYKKADGHGVQEKEGSGKQGKEPATSTRSMFANGFEERHNLEQYFWSERTVMQLKEALKQGAWHTEHGHVCCLAAPSLAHAFYTKEGRIEALLDIDTRFKYLPGFRRFDLCNPNLTTSEGSGSADDYRIVVFDPPFFYIPLDVLFQAVLVAVHGNLQTKLLVGFLRREEGALLQAFAPFGLRRTRFVLEYATVKPNKWRNYALYSNVDLPGIKRVS